MSDNMDLNTPAIVIGHAIAVMVVYVAYLARKHSKTKVEKHLPMFYNTTHMDTSSTPVTVVPMRSQLPWVPSAFALPYVWASKAHAE